MPTLFWKASPSPLVNCCVRNKKKMRTTWNASPIHRTLLKDLHLVDFLVSLLADNIFQDFPIASYKPEWKFIRLMFDCLVDEAGWWERTRFGPSLPHEVLPGLIVFLRHWMTTASQEGRFISSKPILLDIKLNIGCFHVQCTHRGRVLELLHTARSSGALEDFHQRLKPKVLLFQLSTLASFALSFPFSLVFLLVHLFLYFLLFLFLGFFFSGWGSRAERRWRAGWASPLLLFPL